MAKTPQTPLGKDITEFIAAVEKAVKAGQEIKAKLEKLQKKDQKEK